MLNAAVAVILLALMRGITVYNCVGALAHKFFVLLVNFFATSAKPQAKLQPQHMGVMLLILSSPKITDLAHRVEPRI
jgi:hypothetical protein